MTHESDRPSMKRLPTDILHQILDDFIAFRLEEVDHNCRKDQGPKWAVIPILVSCRQLSEMLLPKLYRHVVINHCENLLRFMAAPALKSFTYLRALELRDRCIDDHDFWWTRRPGSSLDLRLAYFDDRGVNCWIPSAADENEDSRMHLEYLRFPPQCRPKILKAYWVRDGQEAEWLHE